MRHLASRRWPSARSGRLVDEQRRELLDALGGQAGWSGRRSRGRRRRCRRRRGRARRAPPGRPRARRPRSRSRARGSAPAPSSSPRAEREEAPCRSPRARSGTRRPTQLVTPTKCAVSSWARCSTPSGPGTARLIVSPLASASRRRLGCASSTSVCERVAAREAEQDRARAEAAALAEPLHEALPLERADEPRGRALRQARRAPRARRPTAAAGDSTTRTSSCAARSIAWVPVSAAIRPYCGTSVPHLSNAHALRSPHADP